MLEALTSNNQIGSHRERKKIEYRNKIISAAINLFSNKGYEATSIAEIMKFADLGVGTFYNYFSSKDDVIIYLSQELNVMLERAILTNLDKLLNPLEQMLKVYEILGRELEENKGFAKVVFLELLRQPMYIRIISKQQKWLITILDNIVKKGQENDYFRKDLSSERLVNHLLGNFMQTVYYWLDNETESLDSNLAFDLDIILVGINIKKIKD